VRSATTFASTTSDRLPAWSLAVLAIVVVQLGSAFATGLFGSIGPAGTVWLRHTFGALIFLAIRRPRLRGRSPGELAAAFGLGVITGITTVCFLTAVSLIPLGTAVAIEFLGPLVVSVIGARSLSRVIWPVLAFAGVLALTQPWAGQVAPQGIAFAAVAGLGWGAYILLTARIGDRFEGLEGLSITIPVAALTAALFGVPQAIGHVTPVIALAALGLALLQPVSVFALELTALRRLTTTAFGTLMALEPAAGMLVGAVILAQIPSPLQVAAVALIVVAGIGATRGGSREQAPVEVLVP
jgi:inner membrane transporter RhtA